MSKVVNLGFDPEMLGEAVMNQYCALREEINKEIAGLGFKTDEERAWFQCISFAIGLRHERAPTTLGSLPPPPKSLRAMAEKMLSNFGVKGSNLDDLASIDLSMIDGLSQQFDILLALSNLGMTANSLDLAALCLSEDEDYEEFVCLLLLAREELATYRLRIIGIARRKLAAKANAIKRHRPTYLLRDEVIDYWKANISSALSNEKAADLLLPKFQFRLSHRKLKQYVAEAKRKSALC